MLKINSPIARETMVKDPETGKPIVLKLDPPGLMIGLRTKQSKQTYMISIMDVWMAAKNARGEDFKALIPHPKVVKAEPDISEVVKEILSHNDRLHFSQLRSQLKKKGIDISRRVAGSILKLMSQTKQIEHDERMYYYLTNKAS